MLRIFGAAVAAYLGFQYGDDVVGLFKKKGGAISAIAIVESGKENYSSASESLHPKGICYGDSDGSVDGRGSRCCCHCASSSEEYSGALDGASFGDAVVPEEHSESILGLGDDASSRTCSLDILIRQKTEKRVVFVNRSAETELESKHLRPPIEEGLFLTAEDQRENVSIARGRKWRELGKEADEEVLTEDCIRCIPAGVEMIEFELSRTTCLGADFPTELKLRIEKRLLHEKKKKGTDFPADFKLHIQGALLHEKKGTVSPTGPKLDIEGDPLHEKLEADPPTDSKLHKEEDLLHDKNGTDLPTELELHVEEEDLLQEENGTDVPSKLQLHIEVDLLHEKESGRDTVESLGKSNSAVQSPVSFLAMELEELAMVDSVQGEIRGKLIHDREQVTKVVPSEVAIGELTPLKSEVEEGLGDENSDQAATLGAQADNLNFTRWISLRIGEYGRTIYWYSVGELYDYLTGDALVRVEVLDVTRGVLVSHNVVQHLSERIFLFRDRDSNEVLTEYRGSPVMPIHNRSLHMWDASNAFIKTSSRSGQKFSGVNTLALQQPHDKTKIVFTCPLTLNIQSSQGSLQWHERGDYCYIIDGTKGEKDYHCSMLYMGAAPPLSLFSVMHLTGWRVDQFDLLPVSVKEYVHIEDIVWTEAPFL